MAAPAPQRVIATSTIDTNVKGSASVEVSQCTCRWNISLAGDRGGSYSGTYAVRIEPQGFDFDRPASGTFPYLSFITGPINGIGTYEIGVGLFLGASDYWQQMDPQATMPQLIITSYVPGEYVEGFLVGELHQLREIGPPTTYWRTAIDMTFRAAFFDPFNPGAPPGGDGE